MLLSSHLMAEVEELCDRVAIVGNGRVLYEGSLPELIATTAGRYELRTTDDVRAAELAERHSDVDRRSRRQDGDSRSPPTSRPSAKLSIALGQAGVGIHSLQARTATLEELFFRMTES